MEKSNFIKDEIKEIFKKITQKGIDLGPYSIILNDDGKTEIIKRVEEKNLTLKDSTLLDNYKKIEEKRDSFERKIKGIEDEMSFKNEAKEKGVYSPECLEKKIRDYWFLIILCAACEIIGLIYFIKDFFGNVNPFFIFILALGLFLFSTLIAYILLGRFKKKDPLEKRGWVEKAQITTLLILYFGYGISFSIIRAKSSSKYFSIGDFFIFSIFTLGIPFATAYFFKKLQEFKFSLGDYESLFKDLKEARKGLEKIERERLKIEKKVSKEEDEKEKNDKNYRLKAQRLESEFLSEKDRYLRSLK